MLTRSPLEGHAQTIGWLAFASTPDQTPMLASANYDGTVRLWNPTTGSILQAFDVGDWTGLAFGTLAERAPLLVTATTDQPIRVWDALGGECVHELAGHNGEVNALVCALVPSIGLVLASAGEDETVRLWNAATGENLETFDGHADRIAMAVGSKERLFVATSGLGSGNVRVCDVSAGSSVDIENDPTPDYAFSHDVDLLPYFSSSIAFGPNQADGTPTLAVGDPATRTLTLCDSTSGAITNVLRGHTESIGDIAFGELPGVFPY